MNLPFLKRASLTRHLMAQKLFKIMQTKKSNLCVAADVTKTDKLLTLANDLGPYIAVLKTHVDILDDFSPNFGKRLRAIAHKHNFLIFEDRKFADIGNTVSMQYRGGIYRIKEWADLINAHIVPGPGIIEGLKDSNLLLLAQMSSEGTIAKGSYTKKCVSLAEEHPKTVMGFISLKKISPLPGMIHFTPGVKLKIGKDALGQKYRSLDCVLIKNKSDIIIVGRDIINAADPVKQAALYQEKGWTAYEQTLS